jgi:hypothetical protein
MDSLKTGVRVKVIQTYFMDDLDTDIKVGDTGVITEVVADVYAIKFDREIKFNDGFGTVNLQRDGSYLMFREQLEVIE